MKKKRLIKDLKEAHLLSERPSFIPQAKYRGVKAIGIGFERKVAKYLKAVAGDRAIHNPWFRFVDANGEGWCSPDVVMLPAGDEPLVIFECKLTSVPKVATKLVGLYLPVVKSVWPDAKDYRLVQVCQNLRRGFEGYLIKDWRSAIDPEAEWDFATWNFRKPPR